MADPNLPWRVKVALVEEVAALGLPGITPGAVYNLPRPRALNVVFPCVQVTTAGEAEELDDGSTTLGVATDWGFRVYLCDRAGPEAAGDVEQQFLAMRKALLDRLRVQARPFLLALRSRVPGVKRVRLRPLAVIDEVLAALPEYQILAGGLTVRIQVSEGRENGG